MASPFPGMDPYSGTPVRSGPASTPQSCSTKFVEQTLTGPLRPKYVARLGASACSGSARTTPTPAEHLIIPDVASGRSRSLRRSFGRAAAHSSVAAIAVADPVEVPELWEVEVSASGASTSTDADDRTPRRRDRVAQPDEQGAELGRDERKLSSEKRREVYETDAHWIEIDLLRSGVRTANVPGTPVGRIPDVPVARRHQAGRRRRTRSDAASAFVWPMPLRERLPMIAIPLRGDDPAVPVDLQVAVNAVVERGGYDLDFDYSRPPTLPLPPEDAEWAATLTDGFVAE